MWSQLLKRFLIRTQLLLICCIVLWFLWQPASSPNIPRELPHVTMVWLKYVLICFFHWFIYSFIYFFLHWEMTHTLDWPKSIVIETLALWLFDESQAPRQHMTQRWHLKHTTFRDGFHFTFAHSENTEMVVEPLPLHLIMGDTHYLVSTHQNSKAATTLTYVDSLQLNTNKQSPLFFTSAKSIVIRYIRYYKSKWTRK